SLGAVTTRPCRAFSARVLERVAVVLATRSTRISTAPSPALGTPFASPEIHAEAAASASAGTDVPRRMRVSGRQDPWTAQQSGLAAMIAGNGIPRLVYFLCTRTSFRRSKGRRVHGFRHAASGRKDLKCEPI